jgi:hypothetical protein
MHGAGIFSAGNRFVVLRAFSRGAGLFRQKIARILFEFFQTVVTAEIIILPLVLMAAKGIGIFGAHAAHRIGNMSLPAMAMSVLSVLVLVFPARHLAPTSL